MDRWEKIKVVFDEALKLPSGKREAYIKEKFINDEKSVIEVLSLLSSYEKAESFLEGEVSSFIKEADENDPLIGKYIGKYKIIKPVAQGGMGTVYFGIRDDDKFKMKAAVKLIRLGLNSEHIIKRFENERQTLANLDHPNIAKLLDGGRTEDGNPYLVMEFIEGKPIDVYCKGKNLSIKERLELFRVVCSAVHYAHQNLIVHRDIKPGNILVTSDGIPKLLDFGIAKILDEAAEAPNPDVTQIGILHFTPEYASPEQVKNENVTTASDIYSLGILLYKIVTGRHPYRINKEESAGRLSNYELSKIIIDKEPEKPSTAVSKRTSDNSDNQLAAEKNFKGNLAKLKRSIKGDLDNIILKAIRKEPKRRYSSVEQFSEDLRKFIAGFPVIASKDTFAYRTLKFVKRHKAVMTAAAAANILIFAAIAAIIWQASIAAIERDNAKLEAKKSNEVRKLVQEMLSSVDPRKSGRDVKVYEVLENASRKINVQLQDQPELLAEISTTLGITYQNLGLYNEGIPHLRKALKLKTKIYSEKSVEYASALKDLALLYHYKGDFSLSDSLYSNSISAHKKAGSEPTKKIVEALSDYGTLLTDMGRFNEAEIKLREALSLFNKLNEKDDELFSSVINNLAISVDYLGKTEEAAKLYRESYNIVQEKYGNIHPSVATATNNLAFISNEKKDYTEAERLFREAYFMKLKLYGSDHPDVGQALHNWGAAFFYLKNYSEAEKKFMAALENYDKSLDSDHSWVGSAYHWLGKVYIAMKKFDKAEFYLREALAIRKKTFAGQDHYAISLTENELGYCLLLKKKFFEADRLLNSSYEKLKKSLGEDNENTINAKNYLSILNNNLNKNN